MKTQVDQVVYASTRKPEEDIRVLYIGYNGWFENIFANTGILCYMAEDSNLHEWYGELPNNFTILPKGMTFIPNRIDIDAIICNSRRTQIFTAAQIADGLHLPLILIEHELPASTASEKLRKYVNSRLPKRCIHVAPNSLIKDEWKLEEDKEVYIIPYGFQTPEQRLRNNNVAVIGDYSPEDNVLLEAMLNCNPEVVGMGNNPGVTTPYKDIGDVVRLLSESYICVTASTLSTPPLLAMLAMSCGAVVVTNKTKWTEQIIENDKTGYLFEKSTEIKKIVKNIVSNRDKMENVSVRAQKYIMKHYNISTFVELWRDLIKRLITRTYVR